jgi:cytochrome P450
MAAASWPPGPKGHLFLGQLPEFRRNLLGFLTYCAGEFGDVVYFRLGPRRVFLISDPDLIDDILVANNRNFIKHFALRMNSLLLGKGLLTSEGDFWRRQRRLMQPPFQRNQVTVYSDVMVEFTDRMLATWKSGEERDLHADMMQLTLEITAKTLFDADVRAEAKDVGEALETALRSFARRLMSFWPVPRWLPTPGNLQLKRAVRRLDEILFGMIHQRRKSGAEKNDLLSILLRAHDPDEGTGMTDRQLRDEAMTLFLAGHETTALALSWTWYLLAQHPAVEAKLLAELQAVLNGRLPTAADLPQLQYTEQVITESMRLFPPVYTIGREAVAECEMGGFRIPAGMTLLMSQWVLHHDSRYFEEPEVFRPERWTAELTNKLPKFAYFPFGGGPRLCIGNWFAMQEAVLVLATMAARVHCKLVPEHPVEPWPSITLRPRYGIRAVVERR